MIMLKGKKGQLLLYGLIAGLIAALVIGFINSIADKREFPIIGDSSLRLLDSSIKAEKALLYIDQSAKYSAYQGIYDLAKNGGCNNGIKYSSYTLWDVDNPNPSPNKCIPDKESSKNNFLINLPNNLNNYLSKYEDVKLISNNYNFDYDNENLMGIAKKPLETPIVKSEKNLESLGLYLIKPSFNVRIDYDFADYDALKEKAANLIEICKGKNPETCIDINKDAVFNGDNFKMDKCGTSDKFFELLDIVRKLDIRFKIYGFCVKSDNYKFYTYDEVDKKVGLRNVAYNFALKFEDIACYLDENTNTNCRVDICDNYNYCNDMVTFKDTSEPLFCYCPSTQSTQEGQFACQGRCPLCECTPWEYVPGASCGDLGCASNERPSARECKHFVNCGYTESDERSCRCEPSCDPCGCSYGPYCGTCGWDECPPPSDDDSTLPTDEEITDGNVGNGLSNVGGDGSI